MDDQTPPTGSQCEQERNGTTLGAKVPGISHQPARGNRNRSDECGTVQDQSPRTMEKLPESDQRRAEGQLARLRSRVVGLLPPNRKTAIHLRAGGMDTTTHSELLLATLARLAWTQTPSPTTGT